MRRLLGNAALLVVVFGFLAVVRQGWEQLAVLSARLGASDSAFVDATVGWAPIGVFLVAVGSLPLRRRWSSLAKTVVAVPLVVWGALSATYLWTPMAGDRRGWIEDLSAGGDAFKDGVVASHLALAASAALILTLAVAQVASPRWQPGNTTNERRSAVASSAALAAPALLALVVVWLTAVG